MQRTAFRNLIFWWGSGDLVVSVVMDGCSRERVPYNRQKLYHPRGCVPYNGHLLRGSPLHQNLDFLDYDPCPRFPVRVTLFLFFLVSLVHG